MELMENLKRLIAVTMACGVMAGMSASNIAYGQMNLPDDGVPWEKTTLTRGDLNAILAKVEDGDRREALSSLVSSCASRSWLMCHLGIFDLDAVGLERHFTEQGHFDQRFQKDWRANRVLFGLMDALRHESTVDDFEILVKPAFALSTVAPHGVRAAPSWWDPLRREAIWSVVDTHMQSRGIPYNTRYAFSRSRAEYIRYLTLSFAIRGQVTEAYRGLELMKNYGKISKKDAWVLLQTYTAVVKLVQPPKPENGFSGMAP